MATQVSYVIVGHKSRSDMAMTLAEQLDAPVSMDYGQLGSNANHDRAWKWATCGWPDWAAVIEDDVILAPNFQQHVQDALEHMPTEGVLSLYAGYPRPIPGRSGKAVRKAQRQGISFLRALSLYWGPAVLMPTKMVASMLTHVAHNDMAYDQRFTTWTQRRRIPVYYTVPSLVEHQDLPSLIWDRSKLPRKAWSFGEPTQWNSSFVDI